MRAPHRPWILSWLLLTSGACTEGTSTGNPNTDRPNGGGVTEAGGYNCKVSSAMELAVDAPTALGFSAGDVLALVEGTHEEQLRWNPQLGFEYGPEAGEHAFSLSVTQKGAPRLTRYTADSGGREIALVGRNCSDAIEIDVEVSLKSDQGALNETVSTTIVARNAQSVSLFVPLDVNALKGSFQATRFEQSDAHLVQLSLNAHFTKYGTQGSLNVIVERRENGAVSAGASRAPLASWGPESCAYYGSPVPMSAVVGGFSGDDVLALLKRAPSASVTFDGSPASTASLSFTAASERACAVLPGEGFATIGGEGSLYVQALLRIKSADGRIDANWPVAISVTPDANGSIAQAQLTFDDEKLPQTGDFKARYGLSGIDASQFDSAIARLNLTVAPGVPLNGQLEVTGFKNAPCSSVVVMNADGSSATDGCMGATATPLAQASIRAASQP